MEKTEEKVEMRDPRGDMDTDSLTLRDDSSSGTQEVIRETWGNKFEYLLACIGFSVAFGNFMRFPYLCVRNGGGAFLIPYFGCLLVSALPLYFLEVCLGQFSGSSPLFVWRLVPLFKGLGWLMLLISGIVSWYYNTIIAWVLYYLYNSFQRKLPWSTCSNPWNSIYCFPSDPETVSTINRTLIMNASEVPGTSHNGTVDGMVTIVRNVSSAKEYWRYSVLGQSSGIDDIGSIQWHLVLAMAIAWIIVFLCLMKGVRSVGKVVYVTVLLPFLLMFIFLIRGLTLPGALDGVIYYVKPDFNRLRDAQVWAEGSVQVFFSLGPTWGGVITMSSYNKFHQKSLRSTVITITAEAATSFIGGMVVFSVLGYMANELQQDIESVAMAGPGLIFIVYPEAISKMPLPHLWAVLFFIMLITIGIDTQFGMFETMASGVVDAFPRVLNKRKTLVTATLSAAMFVLSLPFTTNAGIYIYNLVDWYACSICMNLGGCLELIAVAWFYGADRFSQDIKLMFGWEAPVILRISWCITAPLVLFLSGMLVFAGYTDITIDGYIYPPNAVIIGYVLASIPVMPLPICAIYGFAKASGSFSGRFKSLVEPEDWRPNEPSIAVKYEEIVRETDNSVIKRIKRNLIGRA